MQQEVKHTLQPDFSTSSEFSGIKNPSKYMTLTYVVSLSIIIILSIIIHLVVGKVIDEQRQTGALINISGKQRMLSQRASFFTVEYLVSGSKESYNIATSAIEAMLSNHGQLTGFQGTKKIANNLDPLSPELNALYYAAPFNVDQNVKVFTASIKGALEVVPTKNQTSFDIHSFDFMILARDSLLDGLHEVVSQYEIEGLNRVEKLKSIQDLVFWMMILTIIIEALFIFRPMVFRMSRYAKRLQYEAKYDALSGILNRGAFNLLADNAIASAKRNKLPLGVIIGDIDFFKCVNDNYGHVVGDKVIKSVADGLNESIRNSDVLARFGGEEYVILLPQTTIQDTHLLACKLRQKISELTLGTEEKVLNVTMSFGVAELISYDLDIDYLISRADAAMYLSKQQGRNKVTKA
jgi:diguanylate cyclase (GGDEF)-like protein